MKMIPYDVNKLGGKKWYARSDNFQTLMEFASGNLDCVKIEGYPQKNAAICCTSLRQSIKRYRIHGVQVIMRRDNVFLIKDRNT